jgi:hypothetical protein
LLEAGAVGIDLLDLLGVRRSGESEGVAVHLRMDNVNRSFALAANSTYDLKIVPLIPRFKNTTVNIKCDNGTSTQTTTKF